ncbi:MAG: holin [Candidatus Marinimicrobia bacterium]|nr:holin [Candidatus Neomarinimicrobiota bacterium]
MSAIGLVVALCQMAKLYISNRYIPLLSLVLGIGIVALAQHEISIAVVLTGLTIGVSASGTFAGTKAVIGK